MNTRNARFWTYLNGHPVKLSLRPGQSLSWRKSWRTDEGWDSEACTWPHKGAGVAIRWIRPPTDNMDCDGCLREDSGGFSPLDRLHAGREVDGITFPAWEISEGWRLDEAAEADGY